jgi:solute carrier family 25 carnitine/acylcarnitine transporter 20/29
VVGHPFDTLKVLMQLQPASYPTVGAALRATVAAHGLAGLYRGVGSPLVGNGLYNAVQFAVFARLKEAATDGGRRVTLGRLAAASALTGLCVALVEGPQDLFKSQVQAQMRAGAGAGASGAGAGGGKAYTGTLDCARTILRERGPAGVFQGLQATLARNFVGVGAYFYVYEALRLRWAEGLPGGAAALGTGAVLAAGGAGGLAYWLACYPLDIIKSALQTDAIHPAQRKYAGWADAARQLWAEGGAKRFTAGIAPCLMRAAPANAAAFVAYEWTKNALA